MGWVIYGGGWCRRLAVAKQKGAVARVSAQNKRNTLRSTSQNNTYERKRKNNARETRPASKAAQPPRPQEPQRKKIENIPVQAGIRNQFFTTPG